MVRPGAGGRSSEVGMPAVTRLPSGVSGTSAGTCWVASLSSRAPTWSGLTGAALAAPWEASMPAPTANSIAPARLENFMLFTVLPVRTGDP